MDLSSFKEYTLNLNTLGTKELQAFYRESAHGQSVDGGEVTTYFRLFPKEKVTSIEMAYAIEVLVEKRYYVQLTVDNDGRRVYDENGKRLDGSSTESELPNALEHLDNIQVIDPLPWQSERSGIQSVESILREAADLDVDLDYRTGKVSNITRAQVLKVIGVQRDVLDIDAILELDDAYLLLHWDSTA